MRRVPVDSEQGAAYRARAKALRVAELHPVKDEYKLNNALKVDTAAVKDRDTTDGDGVELLGPTIDGAPRHDLRKLHVVDEDPDLDVNTDPMLRGR